MIIDWKSIVSRKSIKDKGGFPFGTRVYKAHIGGGKTLSMTHDIFELKKQFPKMVTFANFNIYGLKDFYLITNEKQMFDALSYANGDNGVVVAGEDKAPVENNGVLSVPVAIGVIGGAAVIGIVIGVVISAIAKKKKKED